MTTFKTWLSQVEEEIAAEVATSSGGGTGTSDIAGNPFGAGIQYYNKDRDQYGLLEKRKKDKGGNSGLGGVVRPMRFSSGKTAHSGD